MTHGGEILFHCRDRDPEGGRGVDEQKNTSAGRKCDIHLIELESILLAGSIGRYRLVMIEDVVDEIRPFDLGQTPRPFDKAC